MRFLYLDNWGRKQPKNRLEMLLDSRDWAVNRVDATSQPMPETLDYEGVFVGPGDAAAYDGDAWIAVEQRFLASAASHGIPILGLCFGAQTLAWALLGPGSVKKRSSPESGFGTIVLEPEAAADPLTARLPKQMEVFHWHGDEVVSDHPDLIVLAGGSGCRNQIWRWRLGPVWGVQPHPEYDAAGLRSWVERDGALFARGGVRPEDLPPDQNRCAEAGVLFDAFLETVASRGAPATGRTCEKTEEDNLGDLR